MSTAKTFCGSTMVVAPNATPSYGFAASAAISPLAGVPIPVIESNPGAVSIANFWCVQLPVPLQNFS